MTAWLQKALCGTQTRIYMHEVIYLQLGILGSSSLGELVVSQRYCFAKKSCWIPEIKIKMLYVKLDFEVKRGVAYTANLFILFLC